MYDHQLSTSVKYYCKIKNLQVIIVKGEEDREEGRERAA